MSIGRMLTILVVVGAIVGGVLWYMGILNVSKSGVSLDSKQASDSTTLDIYNRGASQFQLLQYEKALATYTQALKERPEDPEAPTALFAIAKCLQETKQIPAAITKYQEFAEKYPADSRAAVARKAKETLSLMN